MFMSVLKVDTTQMVSLVLLISNYFINKIAQGRKYILKKNYSVEITWLYLKKKVCTNLYEGSISISDLAKPLGLTSPSLSAKLSRAS